MTYISYNEFLRTKDYFFKAETRYCISQLLQYGGVCVG